MKPQFSVRSLGCARSLVDSEDMVNQLHKVGFQIVPEGTNESIMVLNTCSFIQAAIDETESNIRELSHQKQQGSLKHLVVAGCYPSRFKKPELSEKFPDVDLWVPTYEEHSLHSQLAALVFQKRFQPQTSSKPVRLTPTHYAYLKISEGCNNWCSFCTIPKIRGAHTSKPLDVIMEEAQRYIDMGAKELVLIAEDTTCWGEDIYGKPSLSKLLRALSTLDVTWIRNMYIFPNRVDDELIQVIKDTPNIANYIDMPIQHVNTELLEAMHRKHDRPFLENIVQTMIREIPDISLRTSLICGFPGETDAHVDEVCDFLSTYPFSQVGCFTYSKERDTRSARMKNPVSLDVAKQRVDRIMTHQYHSLQKRLPQFVGQSVSVIYEGQRLCRSFREAPEVDSVIILNEDPGVAIGSQFDVTITGYDKYDLLADSSV